MAENSSTNSNSWTILAPELQNSGVESMGPLSENQGEVQAEPAVTQSSALSDAPTEQTHPPESPQVTPLESSEDPAPSPSTTVKEDTESSIPTQVENIAFLTSHPGEQGPSGEDSASQRLIDTESFSDSYTHIRPSPLSSSLPGALEEEEEEGEVLSAGEVKGELRKTQREDCNAEDKANEGDGLRRRNISVLTPLYHRDEEEEEEEAEEVQFRHPQREGEGDIGFTLNKCIFGALILLGLGTIFFSERDVDAKDLKYSETKKEWLDPDAQPKGVQPPEILNKLAKEEQVAGLQAQLQKQELESMAEQLQVDEVTRERLFREKLEAENQKMRGELDKLPVLQKEVEQENERVKRETERLNKELEALPALQKELEHLKDKVMELTQNTVTMQAGMPSAGKDGVPGHQERKEKKSKARNKEKDLGTENKESRKGEKIKVDKQHGKEKSTKQQKEWDKEKDNEGRWKREGKNRQEGHKEEQGQRWKLDGEKREEKIGKKRDGKGDKKWEKEKHGEFVDRKGKEDKEWKHKSEQKAWKKEEEWKRDKQTSQKSNEWNEKSEKNKGRKEGKEWGSEKERRGSDEEKYSERTQKEKTRKGKKDNHDTYGGPKERWEKHRSGKEKETPKNGHRSEEWKDEKKYKDKNRNKQDKMNQKSKHEASPHLHSDRKHSDQKHSNDHVHINYWDKQRERIRHYYGSTEGCADVTACAHAEGLAPVSQQDFQAFVSGYLTKLQEHRDQTIRKEKLSKLLGEFFTDGVFVHDQIPFSEFVEDVEDILEDLADDDDELENEMNGFAIEAMETFVHQKKEENEEIRGESGRKRMKG
ncbi:Pre-B-cell leukemia transcription factor-interacting protein 1 [Bagarius yarrelli]|uniref:Pre-B-cell leukemia transcription factor-interacting protein 1 n=1 Tax=Bagarius yarrelli TaxID=175774 RepID=A0A556V9Y1_BAGYA|nr:Pre-B-cell leukemia transcription factor-interacting protein 1 [Bagarius yarrelli]